MRSLLSVPSGYLVFSDEDLYFKRKEPAAGKTAVMAGDDAGPGESAIAEDPIAALAEKAVRNAALEAEAIIKEAKEKAKAILYKSSDEAEKILREAGKKAQELFDGAKEEGYGKGYEKGFSAGEREGKEQAKAESEEKLAGLLKALGGSCEKIDSQREEALEKYIKDLTELVLAISEKIVCVSLESSSEVIKKMILSAAAPAVEKQWAKVTISAEDARRMGEEGIDIKSEISKISDKIELNTVDDAAAGTCLVEFPDQVIDAGANTQLRNIRDIVRGAEAEQEAPRVL